jgi:hypothetical protein
MLRMMILYNQFQSGNLRQLNKKNLSDSLMT